MTMTMIPVSLKTDGEAVVHVLQEGREKLDTAEGDMSLDFSSVRRIDPSALGAMEKLAAKADEKSVKVVLRGVNVDIYKVLKLARLAPRFAFVA